MAIAEQSKKDFVTVQKTLTLNNIEVTYSGVILVLRGVSLSVAPGQIVSLLGPNGAGKSTTLKAISGLLKSETGEVTRGNITWGDDLRLDKMTAEEIVRNQVIQVIEGRPLFRHLTVEENLRVGSMTYNGGAEYKTDIERVYHYFPRLRDMQRRISGYLSGGEAQRVKLASFLGKGKGQGNILFIFDEPTTGLHFHDVRKLLNTFDKLIRMGHSILVIEHNLDMISCADHIIDLGPEGGDKGGQVVAEGTPEEIIKNINSYTGQYLKSKII